MKRKLRFVFAVCVLLISLFCISQSSIAATHTGWVRTGSYYSYYDQNHKLLTGWKNIGGKYYFLRPTAYGAAPKGSRVTGLVKIGENKYFFNAKGVLQTGWQTINGKFYYFEPEGGLRVKGQMYTGFHIIDGGRYYFADNGTPRTGWVKYKTYKYYMASTKTIQTHGRAVTGWRWIGGNQYFFYTNGVMFKNRWIKTEKGNYYYLGSDGKRLSNCVTPDGYIVDEYGKRVKLADGWVVLDGKYYYYKSGVLQKGWTTIGGKKYYLDETTGARVSGWLKLGSYKYYLRSAVMVTGWQVISGKNYYFYPANGRMAVNTTIEGCKIDKNGVADLSTKTVNILLIAGHGQGDVGAQGFYSSGTLNEYQLTREFASLIYSNLKGKNPKISVTMYDQNYDCYAVNAGHRTGPNPNFKNYDYVLEIHFNATAVANKDTRGDGVYKGVGMYINYRKQNYAIDRKITQAIASVGTGFKLWGGGIVTTGSPTDKGLLNARLCQDMGVSYGLLETAFIDDKDGMTFYSRYKTLMAQAVSNAILSHFG